MIEGLIGTVLGSAIQGLQVNDPLLLDLQKWISSLVSQAPARWRAVSKSGIRCQCARPAIGACLGCQEPTCLHHSMISNAGEVLCAACLQGLASLPKAKKDAKKLRRSYLRSLGLSDPHTEEELREAFKGAAFKYHPDRASPDKKEWASKRFLQAKVAYEWLLSNRAA